MKKGFKITAVVLALLLLAGTLAFSVSTMLSVKAMAQEQAEALKRMEEYQSEPHDPDDPAEEHATAEDGVVIAEEYVIRPTTAISDAYLSGDSSALNAKEKETLEMASKILDEIITDGMSDYEKELAVYEWMVSNLAYDSGALVVIPETDEDSDNPYGVLKYHNAVCVGYATTFRLFMQMLEIPCMVVHNSELYHSWDLVQLDGHWYHVDVYSDVGETGYANFNLPDTVRMQQQDWDTDFFPAADALTYNMCWQNRKTVDSAYDVPAVVREAMDEGAEAFALSFGPDFDDSDSALIDQMLNALDTALMNSYGEDQPRAIRERNWVYDEDGSYAMLISFDRGEQDPYDPGSVDEEDMEKADQALQDAFSDLFDISIYDGDNYGDDYYEWEGARG